ncbi:MAG: hypothetical protein RAK24_02930 [TACK group archaeon]|nr:hypothetical protein [TACK group archaeon]
MASRFPRVSFYVQLVIPSSVDLFNATQLRAVEFWLRQDLGFLTAPNVVGVELAAFPYGEWSINWSEPPTKTENTSWVAWERDSGLFGKGQPIPPYDPAGTVYAPLFAQWAVGSTANISATLLGFMRALRPDLQYGLSQYDSVASSSGFDWSAYTFVEMARPNFTLTQNLGLAVPVEGFTSYPYAFVLISMPMASAYRASLGTLWVDDSFVMMSTSSQDDTGTALFKFELNEVSTYLNDETPLVNAFFAGPHGGYVPLQEYVLDPALQLNLRELPLPSSRPAPVLVIRPTYSLGMNSSAYQQQLFYSLTEMGVPFDTISEAYAYANPSSLRGYRYVIYASDQITPQMFWLLDHDGVENIGLSDCFPGYIKSNEPGASGAFNVTVRDFSQSSLFFLAPLGQPVQKGRFEVHFGSNVLLWNATGLYADGLKLEVSAVDYLGLTTFWALAVKASAVAVIAGLAVLALSFYRNHRKSKKLEAILQRSADRRSFRRAHPCRPLSGSAR